MMRLMRPAARVLARLARSKSLAGEVLVFRDHAGAWLVVPIEVLAVQAVAGVVDRRSLVLVELRDDAVAFRDAAMGRFLVSTELFDAARVPPHAYPMVERQLEPATRPVTFEHPRQGPLRFVGTARISYVPDPQDGPFPRDAPPSTRWRGPGIAGTDLAQERRGFRQGGWCRLTGGLFGERLADLAVEGAGLVAATSHEYDLATPENTPLYLRRLAAKGPVLHAVLHDPVVVSMLRALSGVLLVPTLGSYYFYSGNDHISIHTDASHCPFALLVKVFGDPPPLIAFPGLRGCSRSELKALADDGMKGHEPQPMHFPSDGGLFFRGCELPHYRPPRAAGSAFIGVAQLCYRPVWDRIGAPNKMVAIRPIASTPST